MSDITKRWMLNALAENAYANAYQRLAAQVLDEEMKITDEDLLLIEFEVLSEIRLGESMSAEADASESSVVQMARDKVHNSFSAYRRERRRTHRTALERRAGGGFTLFSDQGSG